MAQNRYMRLAVLLGVLLLAAVSLIIVRQRRVSSAPTRSGPAGLISPELLAGFNRLEQRERALDDTVWAPERRAEVCGEVIDELWDSMNRSSNKLEVLKQFPIGTLIIGDYGQPRPTLLDIEELAPSGPQKTLHQGEWEEFIDRMVNAGWTVSHVEFRQRAFDPRTIALPDRSEFSFRADVENSAYSVRATLEGAILVDWSDNTTTPRPHISRLDATRLSVRRRAGEPPFQPILTETIQPWDKWLFIDPLIVYDLQGRGSSDIILPGKNLLFRRRSDGQYEQSPLCRVSPEKIFTAVIADFDNDGFPDLICARSEGLILYHGSERGTLTNPPGWFGRPAYR